MMRILSLPADFFKKYSAGELSSNVQSIAELCEALSETVISLGITLIMFVLYFLWIAFFVPPLTAPAVITTLLQTIFGVFCYDFTVQNQKTPRHN